MSTLLKIEMLGLDRVERIIETLHELRSHEFTITDVVVHRRIVSASLLSNGRRCTVDYMDSDVRTFCRTLSTNLRESTGHNEFYTLQNGRLTFFLGLDDWD